MTSQRVWFLAPYTCTLAIGNLQFCIESTVDEACSLPNKALDELNKWRMANSLTPHSAEREAVLFSDFIR